ncbi:MAG: UDP-N-acetylmuramate--L-alanine ligase [Candidatus Dadabacteria bacterium]|nr:MAG: UDP-N-acetylmuramate--L-alanine ligase [Candidatus Dadabacteria bacterium]
MYNTSLHFHFTGIGGSGMSGIAEILLRMGYQVSGSDLRINSACHHLEELGASIAEGHCPENIPEQASLLVYSSAVKEDNVELVEARRRGLPVIPRAAVLAELMRLKFGIAVAGSHGKTTTTTMIGELLERAAFDPTVIIGGQVKSIGSGGKLGAGSFLVAESDESDRSFLMLKPTIAVVTNIDAEHLVAYGSLSELEKSFEQFVNSVPFYGMAVLCYDDARVRDLIKRFSGRKLTYGLSPAADISAVSIESTGRGIACNVLYRGRPFCSLDLPVPGKHMLLNALAAVSVGIELGIGAEIISQALADFSGVRRRLDNLGTVGGVTIFDDYGHHPTEIKCTIAAIRQWKEGTLKKLHVVFQPHRYSRTRECFAEFLDAFNGVDVLYVTDIYPAGENPIEGISSAKLVEALNHHDVTYTPSLQDALDAVRERVQCGDTVLCLGAGSINSLAERLMKELK